MLRAVYDLIADKFVHELSHFFVVKLVVTISVKEFENWVEVISIDWFLWIEGLDHREWLFIIQKTISVIVKFRALFLNNFGDPSIHLGLLGLFGLGLLFIYFFHVDWYLNLGNA